MEKLAESLISNHPGISVVKRSFADPIIISEIHGLYHAWLPIYFDFSLWTFTVGKIVRIEFASWSISIKRVISIKCDFVITSEMFNFSRLLLTSAWRCKIDNYNINCNLVTPVKWFILHFLWNNWCDTTYQMRFYHPTISQNIFFDLKYAWMLSRRTFWKCKSKSIARESRLQAWER